MSEFQKQAESILKSEMTNAWLEINEKENGREGVDFLVKSPNRKESEVFLKRGFESNLKFIIYGLKNAYR